MSSLLKKATFSVAHVAHDRVFIIDHDIGRSVTNDAEAVVEAVLRVFPSKRIIYRDTDGRWDELVHAKGGFVGFSPYSEYIPKP
jgi:hypothetical protein